MADVPTPDHSLDCRGLLCPMPIVKLSRLIREVQPNQVILMEATDPGSIPDVTAWAKNTGNALLAHETDGRVMRFWIRKA